MDGVNGFLNSSGSPVTTLLISSNIAVLMLCFLSQAFSSFILNDIAYVPSQIIQRPWTAITYPLAYPDASANGLMNLLFGGYIFYMFGGSLERGWGTRLYATFLAIVTLITSLAVLCGTLIFRVELPLYSIFIPGACACVAFCGLQPNQPMSFWFIPLQAKYFALIIAVITWLNYGRSNWAYGLFACAGLLISHLYVVYGRSWNRPSHRTAGSNRRPDLYVNRPAPKRFATKRPLDGSPEPSGPFDVFGKIRARQQQKRLERLMKNSGYRDPLSGWKDDNDKRN